MGERKVRGSVINGYLKYVEKTWGKDGLADCMNKAKVGDIKFKEGQPYPHDMLLGIIQWISKTHGMHRVRQAGNHTVKNLGLLAYIVRFTSIETMLKKTKELYPDAYSFGEVDMKMNDLGADIYMRDISQIPEDCEGWIGALEGLLELTRTRGTVIKTKCRLKDDPHCEYEMHWK